jgi:hypothetical protein
LLCSLLNSLICSLLNSLLLVGDKNPTDLIKFWFIELNKKFRKNNQKTLQNQLNFTFLHLKLTVSGLKIIALLQYMNSQFLLWIIHHEQSKESS